jgi:Domain of unknown function (DUF4837)
MRSLLLVTSFGLLLLTAACQRAPVAYGESNSLIVVAPDDLWNDVQDSVEAVLERRILTTRPERTFDVTQVSPASERWGVFRQFRQVIVIGRPEDGWVKPVLDKADTSASPPALIDAHDVWANQQVVTALTLPERGFVEAIMHELPALREKLDQRFRAYARERMYASGVDVALRDSLLRHDGFSLTLPKIYKVMKTGPDVFVAYNNLQDPIELMRFIEVTWRPGLDSLTTEDVLNWREKVVTQYFSRPQVTQREPLQRRLVQQGDATALELQGVWSAPPGAYPGAGPFIDRVVPCAAQHRTYLVDTWLYAPGSDKYEYVIQLNTLLDGFRCGGGPAA